MKRILGATSAPKDKPAARRKVKASKIVILPSANASMVAKISPTIAKAPRTRAV